jgi:superfamily II DNA or RNA helicase
MLRLHLPPNLAAAIGRDAIPLKVEVDLAAVPPPELLPALALLQCWCAAPVPPKFIQLTRAQLRELVAAAGAQPVFVDDNGPAKPWAHDLPPEPVKEPHPAPRTGKQSPKISHPPAPMMVDGSEHYLAITLPSREHPAYAEILELLKTSGFVLEPSNRQWWLRDRHKTLNFLAAHGDKLRTTWGARFTENFTRRTAHLQAAAVACSAAAAGEDFTVTVALEAGDADEAALRAAVAGNRGYVEAGDRIYLLDAARLAKLAAAQQILAGEPQAALSPRRTVWLPRTRLAEAEAVLEELSPQFAPPEAWQERSRALRDLTTLPPAPLPAGLAAQLRPYQRLGAAWLWHLHAQKLGGILADEMGLGKTLQALGLLAALPPGSRRLVVAPASLLENWRREAARFTPQLSVFVHHGQHRLAAFDSHDLIITSYGTLTRDRELFAGAGFDCVVADEAQHIKNRRSQNAQALRTLRAGTRFLLTGTPLENSLDDLRSLFEFLLPGFLRPLPPGLRADERAWHDERLRAQTAPYILRRTKQSVAPELPPKIEQILWCEPTAAQAALYRRMQEQSERDLLDLAAAGASEARLRLATLTQLLRLRQICCDPRLVEASAAAADSAKFEALRELLDEVLDAGHRALVFSQFTSLLALLRAELEEAGTAHCYLDGAMSARARQAEVDRFQRSPEIPLFLLSLKAGGTGLNLTGADTVVHLDPWWNPAVEMQATDRAHRIGQTRAVTSYKLICAGTVEEKVLALQDEKRALLAEVFEASDASAAKLALSDLRDLLKG